jgi:O-methyltransferase involved in polyketide biosynthesis
MSGAEAISPTAHYTGYVWGRHGLSHPALITAEGRVLFEALRGANLLSRTLGGPSLEAYLLARHAALDTLLARAIEEDGVTQVLELAAGLSPRGWRMAGRYGERITYVEVDLPGMAARKRHALERMGSLGPRHRVVEADVLREGGLEELAAGLHAGEGLAVVTEGLLGYLPTADVRRLWERLAAILGGFAAGRYLSDIHLGGAQTPAVHGFRLVLSGFVRGRVYMHFERAEDVRAALRDAGFAGAEVQRASAIVPAPPGPRDAGTRLAHILEASTK